jgi:hypothetical protein
MTRLVDSFSAAVFSKQEFTGKGEGKEKENKVCSRFLAAVKKKQRPGNTP